MQTDSIVKSQRKYTDVMTTVKVRLRLGEEKLGRAGMW
jgi:hypothetical protein